MTCALTLACCTSLVVSSHESLKRNSHSLYTEYTPVACTMNNTVFSQARTCNACLWLKAQELQRHHRAHENSSVIWSAMSSFSFHIFSLPVLYNTKHHLDSTTFSKTTLYTEHFFQNLYSRQAALTNCSRTSIPRVAETRATLLPQVLSPRSLRQFLELLWKTSINYTMYKN